MNFEIVRINMEGVARLPVRRLTTENTLAIGDIITFKDWEYTFKIKDIKHYFTSKGVLISSVIFVEDFVEESKEQVGNEVVEHIKYIPKKRSENEDIKGECW